ncbi:Fis family transcriptional regulator [uncultured Vibrio sp.]|uniref:Fis family transcriptional regulator n=1 Tax=uncultured Vibrio sp. TaxID=114054 RepID=UPI0025E41688|nr:Fis family transcriptional regulator [uncultured Vibrio sp.]
MRKTDKKIDNQIRESLTLVCDDALNQIEGFQWLTHTVNYSNFPSSLKIVGVFDTDTQLESFQASEQKQWFSALVSKRLNTINITFKNIDKHILFDTEQACDLNSNGNWARRLSTH